MLIMFNKPFQVLSQFSTSADKLTLKDFIAVPRVVPAGRLDYDSEGLLLLTDDGRLQHQISHPDKHWSKTYWVQVEGQADDAMLTPLRQGISLNDGPTRPAQARMIAEPDDLWPRTPAIRYRAHIPTSWLEISISEGRNRQVRRMTAHIGLPTLRLVRVAIGPYHLGTLPSGEWQTLPEPSADAPVHRWRAPTPSALPQRRPPFSKKAPRS